MVYTVPLDVPSGLISSPNLSGLSSSPNISDLNFQVDFRDGKTIGEVITELDKIDVFCAVLKKVLDQLNNRRRKEILVLLSPDMALTFQELKTKTGISTGSLHHHLTELCRANLVKKDSQSWPHKYSRSPFLVLLIKEMDGINKPEKTTVPERTGRKSISHILKILSNAEASLIDLK